MTEIEASYQKEKAKKLWKTYQSIKLQHNLLFMYLDKQIITVH